MKIEKETFEHSKVMLCQLSLLFGYEETLTAFASTEWEEVPNNHNLFRTKFIEINDTATKWVYVALVSTGTERIVDRPTHSDQLLCGMRMGGVYTLVVEDEHTAFPKGLWTPPAMELLDGIFIHSTPELKTALIDSFENERIWHCVDRDEKGMASFITIYGGKSLTILEVTVMRDLVVSISRRVV
jgi:hypothetical protein